MRFQKINGVVSNLRITQDEESFVQTRADQAVGGAAAIGLAVGGLAGAATGAVLSSGDAADKVDFFTCTIDGQPVWGRFGIVSFKEGDSVEVVGENARQGFEAYAVTRPSDRTIWMYPHCSRGSKAHVRFSRKWIFLLCWIIIPVSMFSLALFAGGTDLPWTFWPPALLGVAVLHSLIFAWVASRFMKFARLSNDIFTALGFEKPDEVDLLKRLRVARKSFSNEDHLKCSPHVRWVYKY